MKILVTGAGGFIGGHLVKHFHEKGGAEIMAIDKKPLKDWYQHTPAVMELQLDLSDNGNRRIMQGVDEVYQLAADMGGMGFIESHRVECLRSVLINTHLIEAAYKAGVQRYFYSSSACVYNTQIQADAHIALPLKESDAYPALAERGYGWEKLFSEMVCQEYAAERKMKTFIARFHNVYGPCGTWDGGREKAPAAICRKVIEAVDKGTGEIEIWGDGSRTRSYQYIDDCIKGIDLIMHCDSLIATPINLGSSELVSVNELVTVAEKIAGVTLKREYDLSAPQGVGGRNSDNTFIKSVLGWEPSIPLKGGLEKTYAWIEKQYKNRKAGLSVVV